LVNFALRLKVRSASSSWLLKLIFTLGVPLHELGHYIACRALFLKVTKAQYFPNFKDPKQMGFVQFIPRKGLVGALSNMLVGLAPMFLGALVLFVMFERTLTSEAGFKEQVLITFASVILMQSMLPSWQDIQISLRGLFITVAVGLCVYYIFPLPAQKNYIASHEISYYVELVIPHLFLLTLYQATALLVVTLLSCRKR
jgi:hypothetical protein